MRFRPISPAALADEVAARATAREGRLRLFIDGAAPTAPATLADEIAQRLRVAGRPVMRVSTADFLRPASLRFERGRTDPDARYSDWLDVGGLRREVLDPQAAGGSGRVLPRLWNARTDRSARADYVEVPADGVVIVDGEFLLGQGLPGELTVHLWLSPGALARRLAAEEHWALPAFARYEREARPLYLADVGVRADDPLRLAVLDEAPR
ncbi:Uridine kinase [Alloactinosynnema sp. L-07]|uniref:uridine kinase n=1 Tax=Alloactinosynnema sp. L-07 TaxID=1653480 RepID=UPI00065F0655|nr:uridine kinase [Alloactinosynnema sp. L-07]CRK58401.1 Uridine kinase [Alloactinosynnema sp. L-07]